MRNFVGLLVLTLSVSSAFGSDLPRTPEEQSLDRIPQFAGETSDSCSACEVTEIKDYTKPKQRKNYFQIQIEDARDLDAIVGAVFDFEGQTTGKDQKFISAERFAYQYYQITRKKLRREVFVEYLDSTGNIISREKGDAAKFMNMKVAQERIASFQKNLRGLKPGSSYAGADSRIENVAFTQSLVGQRPNAELLALLLMRSRPHAQ